MQDDLSESNKKISYGDCSFIKPKKWVATVRSIFSCNVKYGIDTSFFLIHVNSQYVIHVRVLMYMYLASYDRDSFMSSKISALISSKSIYM